jgi:hypothetical protein
MNLINVGGKPMIVDERRSKILQIAEESGFVSLQRLVAEVGRANQRFDGIWNILTVQADPENSWRSVVSWGFPVRF